MSDVINILIITGTFAAGVIVISCRYVKAKAKIVDTQRKLEREDLVQVYRRD